MSAEALLQLDQLTTELDSVRGVARAVDKLSIQIRKGETYVLLGESGCGKSMTALSIMGLLPSPAGRLAGGHIYLEGEDLTALSEQQMRNVRGTRVAMIFQEPMTSLNPVMTVAQQIGEVLQRHTDMSKSLIHQRMVELLDSVGIPDPVQRLQEYPHQLSGGMKQRVMIAIALAGEPDLLIADEPTTALDVTIQAQVLELLLEIKQRTGMAILLITHDLGVVAQVADRVGVMYAGQLVEQASVTDFFSTPQHPYSQKLFDSLPEMDKRGQQLDVIRGNVPPLTQHFTSCRFVDRCDQSWEACSASEPDWIDLATDRGVRCLLADPSNADRLAANADKADTASVAQAKASAEAGQKLLTVRDLRVHFPIHKGLFKSVAGHVHAVDGLSLDLDSGRTLALVGESGCGKTTAGKGILQLLRQWTSGRIELQGRDLMAMQGQALRDSRTDYQIIFQDPYASMNPRMMVDEIIQEGMVAQKLGGSAQQRSERVAELLEQVGLTADMRYRYPHEFSGGQRQRLCIARALAVQPKLIVCDEPTSALDVSVQAQVLNLLKELQGRLGLAYLFITHDISVVAYMADEVAVMYLGRIVEQGPVDDVLNSPRHPYTEALLSAVPQADPGSKHKIIRLSGEMPSPITPPPGCYFHPRCPKAMPECKQQYPEKTGISHTVSCHLYD